jgi:hypothetical protein
MFGKLFDSKKEADTGDDNHQHIVEKISKMNLSDMRAYVKNHIKDFEVCEDGLQELMHKLVTKDEDTLKYYINSDDMPTKKKKAFDLIILIASSRKITPKVVEYMQKFLEVYADIIAAYDREYKEIYSSRFKDAISLAVANINQRTTLQNKMNVLGE